MFFIEDSLPHEERPKLEQAHRKALSSHIIRAGVVLLAIITELQAYFHFDGASINARIHEIWNALMLAFEVRELYEEHYKRLMEDKGIRPAVKPTDSATTRVNPPLAATNEV